MQNPLPSEYRGLRALSIRQPWAWFIVNSTKRIENRDWPPRYRDMQLGMVRKAGGKFLIHASSGCTKAEYYLACETAEAALVKKLPNFKTMERGGIVGVAEEGGWVEASGSRWCFGPGAIVLCNVKPLPFVPCKGMLGFFWPSFNRPAATASHSPMERELLELF